MDPTELLDLGLSLLCALVFDVLHLMPVLQLFYCDMRPDVFETEGYMLIAGCLVDIIYIDHCSFKGQDFVSLHSTFPRSTALLVEGQLFQTVDNISENGKHSIFRCLSLVHQEVQCLAADQSACLSTKLASVIYSMK